MVGIFAVPLTVTWTAPSLAAEAEGTGSTLDDVQCGLVGGACPESLKSADSQCCEEETEDVGEVQECMSQCWAAIVGGAGLGAFTGAGGGLAFGSAFPGIGNAAGTVVGAFVGAGLGAWAGWGTSSACAPSPPVSPPPANTHCPP
jgi:phage tail tape-measure protein